jgi:SAM-dependent methyltransferase
LPPSASFVAGCVERLAGVDARVCPADALPWTDDTFDLVLPQLVLNFLPGVHAGVEEMLRVTSPGGTLCACTWHYARDMQMLRTFWATALELDPRVPRERGTTRWCSAEELEALWLEHGLAEVRTAATCVRSMRSSGLVSGTAATTTWGVPREPSRSPPRSAPCGACVRP